MLYYIIIIRCREFVCMCLRPSIFSWSFCFLSPPLPLSSFLGFVFCSRATHRLAWAVFPAVIKTTRPPPPSLILSRHHPFPCPLSSTASLIFMHFTIFMFSCLANLTYCLLGSFCVIRRLILFLFSHDAWTSGTFLTHPGVKLGFLSPALTF